MPVDHDIASAQWARYRYMAEQGHYQFLEKAYRCDEFVVGNQWSQPDLQALKQANRPAMTINKILATIGAIEGEQIANRNEVLFRPKNGGPEATADALTKVWQQIAQNNQLPWVRSDVFADGIIRSRGFYDVRLDFNDAMQGEVRISLLNSKNVLVDPDAEEYDPDYWNDVMVSKWLTPQDIAILYSEEDAELFKTKSESSFPYSFDSIERVRDRFAGPHTAAYYNGVVDASNVRRNVRTLERQHRMLTKQKHFVDVSTGDMRPIPDNWGRDKIAAVLDKTNGSVSVISKQVKRIRWTVTADDVVLHDDWSPYKHFTVVPYFPHFRYGKTVGVVENLISPQEILNKVSSQELHIVNTTANSGWKVRAGSLVNMSIEELEQTGAQTGLVLELDDIGNAEKIQPNQTPNGLDRISYKAEEHIKTISAVSDSMQGFDREDVAAKAIAYKQQRSSQGLSKIMDNLERTDFILARNVLDLVQGYYTEERVLSITHADVTQEAEQFTINERDPASGEIVNDLTLGEYDITITSQPYRATLEDSQFEQARAMREIGVAIPDSVLIENSRLMRKAEILKQMQGDAESPEAIKAAELDQRAREAEVAKLEADAAKVMADAKLASARAAKEQREAMTDGDVVAEREIELKAQAQERELAMKERTLERELALKERAQDKEFELKEKAAANDQLLKRAQAMQAASATANTPNQPNDNK